MFEPFSSEPERINEYLKWQEIFNFEGGEFYQNNPILQEHMSDKPLNMRNFLLYHGDYARANKVLTKFGVKALDKIPDRYTISGNKITFNYVTRFMEKYFSRDFEKKILYNQFSHTTKFLDDVLDSLVKKY